MLYNREWTYLTKEEFLPIKSSFELKNLKKVQAMNMNMLDFKDIKWFEWLYKINNKWDIIALNFKRTWFIKLMKTRKDKNWYLIINLCKNSIKKYKKIHRLVLENFWITKWNELLQVNHINGIKDDNRIENLEWCNNSENQLHRYRVLNKWYKKWIDCKKSKLIWQYNLEWNFIKKWHWTPSIQEELWFTKSWIRACCVWKQKTAYWFIWKYL